MGSYQALSLRLRLDLGAMAMKGYSAFPKLQHYWNLTIRFFVSYIRTLVVFVCVFFTADMQSVYFTALADWVLGIISLRAHHIDKIRTWHKITRKSWFAIKTNNRMLSHDFLKDTDIFKKLNSYLYFCRLKTDRTEQQTDKQLAS